MSKFKAGDRVRRVSNFTSWAPKGFESVVHGKDDDLRYTDVNGDKDVCLTPSDWELIPPSPVRTVTRKEIVPGTYGVVDVTFAADFGAGVYVNRSRLTADELRAAAATLIELADALPLNAEGGDK